MKQKIILITIAAILTIGIIYYGISLKKGNVNELDSTPQNITLSGVYVCLPHMNPGEITTKECMYGIKTDDGNYYAIDFGNLENSNELFQADSRVNAEGFVVSKEALTSDKWTIYNMRGLFNISRITLPSSAQGKLNIDAICEGALSYMTFPDGKSADAFVSDCKAGKSPEVIEKYKKDMGVEDGAAI